jgi:hypothetical protein
MTGERAWGDHEPEPVEVELGPWRFELRGDELADVAYDGTIVARSIRAVARDRDWGTVHAVVDSFALRPDGSGADLEVTMRGLGADLHAHVAVRADESRLEVRLAIESRTEFASNRLGLVVLHQPELAGVDLEVGTPDGRVRRTTFPVTVSPHQPAMDIERLAWTHDGLVTSVDFTGEVFEMEDQRNWTDASYKTYSTPLARPFPVIVPEGAVIEQSVAFEARRVAPRVAGSSTDASTAVSTEVSPVLVELMALDRLAPAVTLGASTVPDDACRRIRCPTASPRCSSSSTRAPARGGRRSIGRGSRRATCPSTCASRPTSPTRCALRSPRPQRRRPSCASARSTAASTSPSRRSGRR